MAVVMNHGGNEPPHPFHGGFGDHLINAVPPKRRGMTTWFDFGAISNDPMASVYWASQNNRMCARYRGRKNIAKTRFTGFKGDVEAARAQAPQGMDPQRWSDVIDHFLTKKHQERSAGNKECRKKQVVKNRGGTCGYGSACFKNASYNNSYSVITYFLMFI
ncbi:unnamed protein product [Lactuca virosa]|uniref:AP2/ERF domain-containing protein n=1 Tax=Lactuca virosa TaxID=75947 RepID=A0AAU9NVZ5_9ASTR|nr:unnamed protein product [Lactuca virosa]